MQGLKSKMADRYCIILHCLAYKGLKSSNSVRIRFNLAEESKYVAPLPELIVRPQRPLMGQGHETCTYDEHNI